MRLQEVSPGSITSLPQAGARSPRILIVDDNRDIALTMSSILEYEGYEVRCAHDGTQALAICDSFAPHVVLLDIGLPDLDGYVVAQTIRQRCARHSMRIFAVTGYGSPEDREQALASGFDRHIVKPVPAEQLITMLAETCRVGQPRAV